MNNTEDRIHVYELHRKHTCITKRVGDNSVSMHADTKTSVDARFPTVAFCKSPRYRMCWVVC